MSAPNVFSGWVYISQAEDLPGCWVAHCLDFNIVSTGNSPHHALGMVREALAMALVDDLSQGRDPSARRIECDENDWAPVVRLFEKHTKVPISKLDENQYREFAVPITLSLVRRQEEDLSGSPIKGAFLEVAQAPQFEALSAA